MPPFRRREADRSAPAEVPASGFQKAIGLSLGGEAASPDRARPARAPPPRPQRPTEGRV